MSNRKRRRRVLRRRRTRRILLIAAIVVLVLGIAGLVVWLALERTPEITIQSYPVEYEEIIRDYAAQNNIPPAYVASVILAESSYQPDAVSSVEAQGLMQILPSTAEWIAGKLGETYVEGCLFDPETNVRYGCWYLGFLMNRYAGDMRCASSAYHAGQGTVDKWLANPDYSPDGATLSTIPYQSTDTYVQRVLKYYDKYDEIYAENEADAQAE